MTNRAKRISSAFLNNSMAVSPSLQRTPAADNIDAREEEDERRKRRGIQKRNSFGPGMNPATPAGATPSANQQTLGGVAGYSAAQLADHYASCMKLSAENKISAKNAFQLRLIDYMAEMMLRKKQNLAGGGKGNKASDLVDNFQAASCALDASTKIYAYRVDSVHSETLRLANGVTSSANNKKGGKEGEVGDEGGNQDDMEEDNRKRPTKRKKKSATLEKNLNNINCAKFELEFDVDPLFKKVSAQFDSGAGGGQFLSTLNLRDDSCELLLDSTAKVTMLPNLEDPSSAANLPGFKDVPLPVLPEGVQICPTFASFTFRDWTLEKEEDLNKSKQEENPVEQPDFQFDHDDHAFDAEAAAEDAPIVDDGDLFGGDFGGDCVGALDGDEEAAERPRVAMALMDLASLRDHLTTVPNEYSYFDSGRMGAWAGPKHWKFRGMPKGAARISGSDEKKKQQKKEKKKMHFDEVDEEEKLLLDQIEKAMMVPKKTITLLGKTMDNWLEEKVMLPEDLHYSGKDFVRLEALPKSNVAPRSSKQSQSVDDNVDDYDYNNPNDTQNFCPDLESGQDNYADDNTHPSGEFTNVFSQTVAGNSAEDQSGAFGGEGLVSAPNRVEKVQIGYAKLAKKIDMRKLKSAEWTILSEDSLLEDTNEDKENSDAANQDKSDSLAKVVKETQFSSMYQTLKQKDRLPSKMTDSLSVPLAFVALLHLCNEQTLQLSSNDQLNDLIVRQG